MARIFQIKLLLIVPVVLLLSGCPSDKIADAINVYCEADDLTRAAIRARINEKAYPNSIKISCHAPNT